MRAFFLNLFLAVTCTNGARILGYIPTPSYSHQVPFQALWRELSLRGHQVTTITSHPINDHTLTNLTEIDLSPMLQSGTSFNPMEIALLGVIGGFRMFFEQMVDVLGAELAYDPVLDLINGDGRFDLVIGEHHFATPFAFAHRFGCPSIGVISIEGWSAHYGLVGSPNHPILYPEFWSAWDDRLSIVQHVENFILYFWTRMHLMDYMLEMDKQLIDKHFGSDYPSPQALMQNVSLLFVNSEPVFNPLRALMPSVIQIGTALALTASKPLPKELKATLDNASNGFIYFSLGSNVQSEMLPPELLDVFLSVFAELPYTVLWKFGSDILPNKTDNIIISKWFPQPEVLKHPNIKLFITQGGVQSLGEAVSAHVPIVGVPFLVDQPYNVKNLERKGCGLMLDYRNLDREQFKLAILEVINNPRYRNTMKRLSELALDQPMTGVEKAVWWVEYVLRHKGAKHLKSPFLDLPWYQYLLLDVIGVVVLTLCAIVLSLRYTIRIIGKIV
ncbi:UDP-glucuronosyltransferase 2C1-like [Photinus pyralis]|uniref:UDP-glucuronosyltransferase 2C1-like n=1 Tax=Photinus pyralis TaxID=7054 RepID=UPI00126712D9|nr:UDP-glucuronosyltransferase 2C1-like [Photinus pyralis]